MKLYVFDWANGGQLVNGRVAGITHNSTIDGTQEDAIRIAGELFVTGVNVMLKRNVPFNRGTRKNPDWTEESITIFVDDQRFGQR